MTATKTKVRRNAAKPLPESPMEAATRRVRSQVAIDLRDLAVLMNVHVSTAQRAAANRELPPPITAARIGQRWVVPTAPVREFLCLTEVSGAA